ncbi:hypothetical protein [Nocardia salmonicida]
MSHRPIQHLEQEFFPTATALAGWVFDRNNDTAEGECPACGGEMEYEFESTAVAMGAGQAASGGTPRQMSCGCKQVHRDNAGEERSGCGHFWYVRVKPDDSPPLIPETDQSLKHLADQLAAADPGGQEAKVRAAAEKWVGAVTALLGLFGLSGVAFGKDAFAGLDTGIRGLLALVLVVAVAAAGFAVFFVYRAAYGWPRSVDIATVSDLEEWNRNRRASAATAAGYLKAGVHCALGSVVVLCVAAGIVMVCGASKRSPLVEVTSGDDSKVCGELLNSSDAGKLRVRRADGTVAVVDGATSTKIFVVSKCGS